jgi:mono/diheme cytochrome c family protein
MNKRLFLSLLPLLAAPLLTTSAQADAGRGETLHNQQCIACHASRFGDNGSAIYTRSDRRVTSLAGLHKQVTRCKDNLGIAWFDDEVKDVAEYLNASFYHFEE